ncbi:hypothetical protein GO730_05610 [Spirosoma sp. HMF3257]|uniref:Uncharacterized protein n=1 Tax=Spirosoma telluris TaxID=2183553 RepID=A0A327NFF0_9BACT|nr:hypothetical protein [Spirosoma telluris]RAI73952.1 hypothetical protein HMF3257_05570 [Spirosoma telluris]
MQVELFSASTAPEPAVKSRKKAVKKVVERSVIGSFTFDSWVSWPARAVNAEDGLRIEFSVPVHSDLVAAVNNPDKTEILCKYRVKKGFRWGELGRRASVKIEAELSQGPKGGLYLHCHNVEILQPVAINNAKPSSAQLKKWAKAAVSAKA